MADFEDIIATVAYLLSKNMSAEFWTTYQERRYDMNCSDGHPSMMSPYNNG